MVTDAEGTRRSLLLSIRNGQDSAAWEQLVRIYAPLIYRYCRRKELQDADAADVTPAGLADVSRCIGTFEYQPERGRFRDWLGTLTCSIHSARIPIFHA